MRKLFLTLAIVVMALFFVAGCNNSNTVIDDDNDSVVEQQEPYKIYRLATEAGYTGTYEEWLKSIKGEKGDPGVGIASIRKTNSDGNVDTYVFTLTDGSSTTFTITNGKDGAQGPKGEAGTNGTNGTNGTDGQNGKSAYELAVEKGYSGTLEEWLESLRGEAGTNGTNGTNGVDGQNGKSAYELAVEKGYSGTLEEWLESLRGEAGTNGINGTNGVDGQNGKSAYELAVEKGYSGTLEEWLESLKGEAGSNGTNGTNGVDGQNGKSAYELAVEKGYSGTLEEWLESLRGEAGTNGTNGVDGQNGKSAYELAVEKGYQGTLEEWLESLRGEAGTNGTNGTNGTDGQNGKSAYQLYLEAYPEYTKSEAEWLDDLINGRLANLQSFTVQFNSNGGTSVDSQNVLKGDKVAKPSDPTNDGYRFIGWYYQGEEWSFIGYSVTEDMTLTAKWEKELVNDTSIQINNGVNENGTITVKVDNNVSTYSFINNVTVTNGSKYNVYTDILGENEIKTKTSSISIGNNTFYVLVTDKNDNIKLYTVIIRRLPMYTISFVTNCNDSIDSYQIQEGSLIESLPVVSKRGYTFNSWDYDINNPVMSNTAITASWNINNYTITYHLNEGTNSNQNPSTYTVLDNVTFATPTRRGYTFNGWYLEDTFDNQTETIALNTIGNIEFYAKWTIIEYTITYHLDSGTNYQSNPSTYTVLDNVTFAAPTRRGYTFNGWYLEDTFDNQIETIELNTINNIEVYAKWTPTVYTITYHLNEGTNSNQNPSTYTLLDEITFATPTRRGYTFDGWYLEDTFDNQIDSIALNTINNIEVYAKWICHVNYSINNNKIAITGYNSDSNTNDIVILYMYEGYSVTSIGEGAFIDCTSLTSITISDSVTSIGNYAFSNCTSLTNITIPDSVTVIGRTAFNNCTSLTSITIPDSVTSIGDYAFIDCTSLTNVTIPDSLTSIGTSVFAGCRSLTSITISDSVTSIGNYAFSNCIGLTSITIPNSVTRTGYYAFNNCTSLTNVYYGGDASQYANLTDMPSAVDVYYYSENEPTENGNYWHYVDDVPTIW